MNIPNAHTRSAVLDPAFGAGGEVDLDHVLNTQDVTLINVYSALVLPDNSIIISVDIRAGITRGPGLIKLTPAGELCTEFGNGTGYVLECYPDDLDAYGLGLTLADDGHLLSFADCFRPKGYDHVVGCTRYTETGERDPSFNNDGRIIVGDFPLLTVDQHQPYAAKNDEHFELHRSSLAVEVEKGSVTFNFTYATLYNEREHSYLVRLTAEGKLDQTFHDRGFTDVLYEGNPMRIWGMTRYQDQGWVLSGSLQDYALVARVSHDGTLDEHFGDPATPGFLRIEEGVFMGFNNALITANHHIIVVGYRQRTGRPHPSDGCILKLDAHGRIDPDFIPTYHTVNEQRMMFRFIAATLTAGEFWVGATLVIFDENTFTTQGILGRFLLNGSPDNNFGTNGYWSVPDSISLTSLTVQPNGKCLITYRAQGNSASRVQRYLP